MTLHTYERIPVTVYADAGQTITLSSILNQAFGPTWSTYKNFWLYSRSPADLAAASFSYWTPSSPSVAHWNNSGQTLPYDQSSYVSAASLQGVTLTAGNSIENTLSVAIDRSITGFDQVTTWYEINIVPASIAGPAIKAPSPADVVAAAQKFDQLYDGTLNTNDCGWITDAVGGAAGAVLPSLDQSIVPTENLEGGYWRIVHRGSDQAVADWQSLVQPGDIVRFDWADPAQPQHTTLIMGYEQPNGTISVFDNGKSVGGKSTIGIHFASYDHASAPASVTVYRLTSDSLYLMSGTDQSEVTTGTVLSDDIRTFGGDDRILAGEGSDRISAGSGNDSIDGGDGLDTSLYSGVRSQYIITLTNGAVTISDTQASRDGTDTTTNVERLRFADEVIALDAGGNAGQAYRMYQAAFARTPDKDGVSYWVGQVDKGLGLHDLAQSFIGSAEFKGIYGANPTIDKLVTGFYTNVLGRAPDSSGLSYWAGQVQSGLSTADLLVSFSESGENEAHVAPAIQNGIELSLSYFS